MLRTTLLLVVCDFLTFFMNQNSSVPNILFHVSPPPPNKYVLIQKFKKKRASLILCVFDILVLTWLLIRGDFCPSPFAEMSINWWDFPFTSHETSSTYHQWFFLGTLLNFKGIIIWCDNNNIWYFYSAHPPRKVPKALQYYPGAAWLPSSVFTAFNVKYILP